MKPSHGAPEQYHNETLAAIVQRQQGVTGLETAIILMAFVVVASIYAFTVLSTGIFSADKGKGDDSRWAGRDQRPRRPRGLCRRRRLPRYYPAPG